MEPSTTIENRPIADIESPYNSPHKDTLKRNILYTRIACRWALHQGYIPYASHLFFTQPGLLDDDVPEERDLGIRAGKTFIHRSATISLFFLDLGESPGMVYGRKDAAQHNREVREVHLFQEDMSSSSFEELLEAARRAKLITGPYTRLGWT